MTFMNPGSHIRTAGRDGWTNTLDGAQAEANKWLANLRAEGWGHDVEIVADDPKEHEGRWTFTFRHTVTGVEVVLGTHGISDVEAYMRQCIFAPRVYWNGSSSANPELANFAAPGYAMTFQKLPEAQG